MADLYGQFKSSQYDLITIQNIDTEDFVFEYNRSEGGYPYTIPAGEFGRYPRFLANHALKHLIDKLMTKKKLRTNNQVERQKLAEEIIIDEEVYQKKPQDNISQQLKKEVDRLNVPSELESILEKRRGKKKVAQETKVGANPNMNKDDGQPTEAFEGLEDAVDPDEATSKPKPKKVKKAEKPEVNPAVKKAAKADAQVNLPTKAQLKTYMKSEMGMTIDDKMEKFVKNNSVKAIMKEIDYPTERLIK